MNAAGTGHQPTSDRSLNRSDVTLGHGPGSAGELESGTAAMRRTLVGALQRHALLLLTWFAVFFICLVVQTDEIRSFDGDVMAGVGKSILTKLNVYRDDLWMTGPHTYSDYGIGVSVLTVPFWVVQRAVDPAGTTVITLVNVVITATTAVLVLMVCDAIRLTRRSGVLAALGYACLTMALQYSTEMFSEPAVTFATIAALVGLLRWRGGARHGPLIVGGSVAIGMWMRPDATVLVGASLLLVPCFVPFGVLRRTHWKQLAALVTPILLSVLWTLLYNQVRYDNPLRTNLPGQPGFSTPLGDGLYRLMLSPGKGFFWYNPLLVVGVVGTVLLLRSGSPDRRRVGWFIVGLSILRTLFYARWWMPDGSVAWGPRFLLPLCPLLSIGMAYSWHLLEGRWRARWTILVGTLVLVAAAVTVNVASVWVRYDQYWAELHEVGEVTEEQKRAIIHGRTLASYNTLDGSPLYQHLNDLPRAEPLGPWRLRGGPDPVAVLAILGFGTCTVLAIRLAGARDADLQDRFDP